MDKEELVTLYSSGKSMNEISIIKECSINKIVYWMDKHNIARRSLSEAIYQKSNPSGHPFSIKKNMNNAEQILYGLALGIYWGEGNKADKYQVRVTNTDPKMILIFRAFLLNICGVKPDKISYSIVSFHDLDELKIRRYWSKQLKISEEKFGKIVKIPSQSKGTYKKKSKKGVASITVSNTKFKEWILNEIDSTHNFLPK